MIALKEQNYINAYPDINAAINNIIKNQKDITMIFMKSDIYSVQLYLNNRINCKINGKERLLKDLEFNQCAIAVGNQII